MATHKLTIRLDEPAWVLLQEMCDTFGVSATAAVQALVEVSMGVYEMMDDKAETERGPTVQRARQIDAQRRNRGRTDAS